MVWAILTASIYDGRACKFREAQVSPQQKVPPFSTQRLPPPLSRALDNTHPPDRADVWAKEASEWIWSRFCKRHVGISFSFREFVRARVSYFPWFAAGTARSACPCRVNSVPGPRLQCKTENFVVQTRMEFLNKECPVLRDWVVRGSSASGLPCRSGWARIERVARSHSCFWYNMGLQVYLWRFSNFLRLCKCLSIGFRYAWRLSQMLPQIVPFISM
jgi:hypothetical protein